MSLMNGTPEINLTEVFESQVKQTQERIEQLSSSNKMAGLLHQNLRENIINGTYNPTTMLYEADANKDNIISIDELNGLIHKLTGEYPPSWVGDLLFKFMGKKPNDGIMLTEYYAYLTTLGIEPPESFLKKDEDKPLEEETSEELDKELLVHLDVNSIDDGQRLKISLFHPPYPQGAWVGFFEEGSKMLIPGSKVNLQRKENADIQIVTIDNIFDTGSYDVRLYASEGETDLFDSIIIDVVAHMPVEEIEHQAPEEEVHVQQQSVEYQPHEFSEYLQSLATCRLSRDYNEKINEQQQVFVIDFLPTSKMTTLLSEKGYKGGQSYVGIESKSHAEVEVQFPIDSEGVFESIELNKLNTISCIPTAWSLACNRIVMKKL